MSTRTGGPDELRGDVDLSRVGHVLADPARCRMLMALNDRRALPATVLAEEAGVSKSTASSHLGKLVDAGLMAVETHGRHRYYRLSGPVVGELLEHLMRLGSTEPVRSLKEGSRAEHLRTARTCYDHLAGRLGVELMACMIEREQIAGGSGEYRPGEVTGDRLAGYGSDVDYEITESGWDFLRDFGVYPEAVSTSKRPLIRYCVDWSEQRHHLGGRLGRALLGRLEGLRWIERRSGDRSVKITNTGRDGLHERFGLVLDGAWTTR